MVDNRKVRSLGSNTFTLKQLISPYFFAKYLFLLIFDVIKKINFTITKAMPQLALYLTQSIISLVKDITEIYSKRLQFTF